MCRRTKFVGFGSFNIFHYKQHLTMLYICIVGILAGVCSEALYIYFKFHYSIMNPKSILGPGREACF